MRSTDRISRPLAAVSDTLVHRTCTENRCGWGIYRPTGLEATLDEATHWVEDHATPADRDRIAARAEEWREHWAALDSGPFPTRLLIQVVAEVRPSVVLEVAA